MPYVDLWSWHERSFDLRHGEVRYKDGEYYRTVPGVKYAYAILHERVGTDQLIWCCCRRSAHTDARTSTKVEWSLRVPERALCAAVNDELWDDLVWNPKPKSDLVWNDAIVVGTKLEDGYTVLITHPVRDDCVLNVGPKFGFDPNSRIFQESGTDSPHAETAEKESWRSFRLKDEHRVGEQTLRTQEIGERHLLFVPPFANMEDRKAVVSRYCVGDIHTVNGLRFEVRSAVGDTLRLRPAFPVRKLQKERKASLEEREERGQAPVRPK